MRGELRGVVRPDSKGHETRVQRRMEKTHPTQVGFLRLEAIVRVLHALQKRVLKPGRCEGSVPGFMAAFYLYEKQ